jgi:hypothetical protein
MDLSREGLHDRLELIATEGWDGPVAALLLEEIRAAVVRPVVRASRLTGPAAAQAEASGWSAAWDAIRRPSARDARNPGGMIWSAVRRAVHAEVRATALVGVPTGSIADLDLVAASEGDSGSARTSWLLGPITDLLVTAGWEREVIVEVLRELGETGSASAWRRISSALELPAWQVRRIGVLVLGGGGRHGLLGLVVTDGDHLLRHPHALAAARSTRVRWQSDPGDWLALLAEEVGQGGGAAGRIRPPVGARRRPDYPCANISPGQMVEVAE